MIAPSRLAALLVVFSAAGGCGRPSAAPASPLVEKGKNAYAVYCATCHGVERNGYVADNAPSLRTTSFLASASDGFLQAAIARGRPGTAMAAYGRAFGGPLGPEDVTAIVAFLREGGPPPVALPPGPVAGDVKEGKAIYDATCARCHGTPAQRATAVHLANPILLQTATDEFLRYAVVEGRAPTMMISWVAALRPKQIDDVVAYVRSMATPPGVPALPPTPPPLPQAQPPQPSVAHAAAAPQPIAAQPAAAPREGPVVLNPRGRAPDFTLKEDLYVSIDQVKAALDQKRRLVIADARAPSEWLNLRIRGAISTPYYDPKALDDIPNDGTWVLAYCACPHHVSGQVVAALRARGYKHTAVIDEGVFAWQQKGYPVVAAPGFKPPPAPPPPPGSFPALPAPPRPAVAGGRHAANP